MSAEEKQRLEFYNDTEKSLWEMYQDICVGDCKVCTECRENNGCSGHFSRPVSAWFVGNDMYTQDIRIMFIGKNARGFFFEDDIPEKDKGVSEGINNAFSSRYDLHGKGWAYWNYTKGIINSIFHDDSPEHVAISNMVKCNNSADKDTTSDDMKMRCISSLMVVKKEAVIINPTHIVFYTGWDYDNYIDCVFDRIIVPGDISARKMIGAYHAPWREGIGILNGNEIRFLRTCHPERKKKMEFIENVSGWIKNK